MAPQHVSVPYKLDVDQLASDEVQALFPVLKCLPGWIDVTCADIDVSQLSGAMTNLIYRCASRNQAESQVVLVRIHAGESDLFDRKEELQTFKEVSAAGIGPKLLAVFTNGRVEEFLVKHSTFQPGDIQAPGISPAVAASMAGFHLKLSGPLMQQMSGTEGSCSGPEGIIWQRVGDWLDMMQREWGGQLPPGVDVAQLQSEVTSLKAALAQRHPLPLAFCHNDLQYGNIMRLQTSSSPPTPAMSPAMSPASEMSPAPAAPCQHAQTKPPPPAHLPILTYQDDTCFEHDSDESCSTQAIDMQISPPLSPPLASPMSTPLSPRSIQDMSDEYTPPLPPATNTDATNSDTTAVSGAPTAPITAPPPLSPAAPSPLSPSASPPLSPDDIVLIDYEYSGVNPVALDIANHWCEWAADYHTDTPHLLDFTRYPSPEEQRGFVAAYLTHLMQHAGVGTGGGLGIGPGGGLGTAADAAAGDVVAAGGASSDVDVDGAVDNVDVDVRAPSTHPSGAQPATSTLSCDDATSSFVIGSPWLATLAAALRAEGSENVFTSAVQQMVDAANDYACLSHLMWALWGYIQAKTSFIDFDFMLYADQRMVMYQQSKARVLQDCMEGKAQ